MDPILLYLKAAGCNRVWSFKAIGFTILSILLMFLNF